MVVALCTSFLCCALCANHPLLSSIFLRIVNTTPQVSIVNYVRMVSMVKRGMELAVTVKNVHVSHQEQQRE